MNLAQIFEQQFHTQPTLGARAPGRVNLLGEHVDYNDGMVLPAAIDRSVYIVAAPSDDNSINLYAADLDKKASFHLEDLISQRKDMPGWAHYPAGVAWSLQQAGKDVRGMNVVYHSDVPIGAGLSSSAAVEVAFAALWRQAGGWQADGMQLAKLCQQAENKYVGVNSGLMDQFASACGSKNHLLYLDTRSLEWHPIPLPAGAAIVIADSGVRRSLTNSAYNQRHAECEEAVELLRQKIPGLKSLRDISSVELAAYEDFLPPVVYKRAEHVTKEILRVEQAVRALNKGDARLFGGMMYSGHNSLRYLYEVSIPELDILVEATRHIPGCYGARLTGAGFGGCTVNLVEESQSQAFIEALGVEYTAKTGREAKIYLCHASQGASAERL
jgi:galactokinase